MRSSTPCTSGTTFAPSTVIVASRAARSATCSTARFSVTLIFSPANIALPARFHPALARESDEQRKRLGRGAVLRVVEKQRRAARGHARAALGIRGEELAQMHVADRVVVRGEREPGGARRERRCGSSREERFSARRRECWPSIAGRCRAGRYVVAALRTASSASHRFRIRRVVLELNVVHVLPRLARGARNEVRHVEAALCERLQRGDEPARDIAHGAQCRAAHRTCPTRAARGRARRRGSASACRGDPRCRPREARGRSGPRRGDFRLRRASDRRPALPRARRPRCPTMALA